MTTLLRGRPAARDGVNGPGATAHILALHDDRTASGVLFEANICRALTPSHHERQGQNCERFHFDSPVSWANDIPCNPQRAKGKRPVRYEPTAPDSVASPVAGQILAGKHHPHLRLPSQSLVTPRYPSRRKMTHRSARSPLRAEAVGCRPAFGRHPVAVRSADFRPRLSRTVTQAAVAWGQTKTPRTLAAVSWLGRTARPKPGRVRDVLSSLGIQPGILRRERKMRHLPPFVKNNLRAHARTPVDYEHTPTGAEA